MASIAAGPTTTLTGGDAGVSPPIRSAVIAAARNGNASGLAAATAAPRSFAIGDVLAELCSA
jgi:hypothetical protein